MRICLIHQYYKTPKTGGAIRSYYIAKYLMSKGHDVVVITAGNEGAYKIDDSEGYPVHYLPVYYENHLGFFSRIHAFLLYVWKAYRTLKNLGPFDLNYIITTPLTTGFIGLRAKRKLKIPYVFEVGDIWPEAPIQLGVIRNRILISVAQHYEKKFYLNSKSIVALSPDIKDHIQRIVPIHPIEVITNFSDPDLFDSPKMIKPKWQDKFVISYIGTVGMANHLEFLISCAEIVSEDPVHFVIAGGGAQYDKIKKITEEKGLTNISFYDKTDKSGVANLLTNTDAVYVSFDNVPILGAGSPNKFFDGLACGKIIILNFKGWVKELVEKNECGFYYNPLKPEEFRLKLTPYLQDPALQQRVKSNSRSLAEQFSPKNQLQVLERIIKK